MHNNNGKDVKKGKCRSLLKEVKIGEVSFVGRGANPGARQSLFKTADIDNVRLAEANTDKGEDNSPATLKKSKEDKMSKEALEKLQKKFDELQAKLTKSEFLASMDDAQTIHYNGLDDDGKAAFAKMDDKARTAAVEEAVAKKAADDETMEVDGNTIKKSEVGAGVFAFMKAQQAKTDAAVAKADKLEAETIQKSLESEAEKMFPNMTGTATDKAAILKGIRALPKEQQDTQVKMLKAADAAMAKSFKEIGQGGQGEASTASEKLTKMAKEYADKNSVTFEKAYSEVMDTQEGAELYGETLKR